MVLEKVEPTVKCTCISFQVVVRRWESSLPWAGVKTAGCTGGAAGWLISTPASHHPIRSSIKTLKKHVPLVSMNICTGCSGCWLLKTRRVCVLSPEMAERSHGLYTHTPARPCPSGPLSDLGPLSCFWVPKKPDKNFPHKWNLWRSLFYQVNIHGG